MRGGNCKPFQFLVHLNGLPKVNGVAHALHLWTTVKCRRYPLVAYRQKCTVARFRYDVHAVYIRMFHQFTDDPKQHIVYTLLGMRITFFFISTYSLKIKNVRIARQHTEWRSDWCVMYTQPQLFAAAAAPALSPCMESCLLSGQRHRLVHRSCASHQVACCSM